MDAKQSIHRPLCHRCKVPMMPHSLEVIDGDPMQIFRCEKCDTLEAVKMGHVAA